jgi:hypothetical protein
MIKNYYIIVLLFLFTSCHYNEAKFIITNNSGYTIDSLNIYPDSKNQYLLLNKNEKKVLYTGMDEMSTDGAFKIKFIKNNELIESGLSYFSNGSQLEKSIEINILNDTIILKHNYRFNY